MDFSQYRGFEVFSLNVRFVTDVFRLFPEIALRVLTKHGIGRIGLQGQLFLDGREWYPLEAWLTSFHDITSNIGPSKMYDIGKQVPKAVLLAPSVVDIRSSMLSLDIGYHLNHRKGGVPMFNQKTGAMLSGIGNYRSTPSKDASQVLVEAIDVPYSCDFDRGILSGFATRFEPNATVAHAGDTCRKDGARSCRYTVTW